MIGKGVVKRDRQEFGKKGGKRGGNTRGGKGEGPKKGEDKKVRRER